MDELDAGGESLLRLHEGVVLKRAVFILLTGFVIGCPQDTWSDDVGEGDRMES